MTYNFGYVRLKPAQVLVIGFISLILMGGALLNLSISSQSGESVGFINAIFTATSAVCVTGLTVVDTGTYWSVFGKTIILVLVQIGGLGFMTIGTVIAIMLGKKVSLKERLVIQESLNQRDLAGLVKFATYIVISTFIIEILGALLLALRFVPKYGLKTGIWYSIFHSISAFCNAGFDLIGQGTGLTSYVSDPIVLLTVILLVIIGGIGFSVTIDFFDNRKDMRRLSFHSKMTLFITAFLLVVGFIGIMIIEWLNPNTLGELSFANKVLVSFFQSSNTRTAGFNAIEFGALKNASKVLIIMLAFVGGSPASTAGGIKTTTFGVILFTIISVIQGKDETEVFKKRVPRDIVNRSLVIAIISMLFVIFSTMILSITDSQFEFTHILLEVVSAFTTIGISLGTTPGLSHVGKILIMLLMFAGRVGILTVAFALARRQHKNNSNIKYPEGRLLVG